MIYKEFIENSANFYHYSLLTGNIEKHYEFENTIIDEFEITDNENNTYYFSKILDDKTSKHKLVFFFSSYSCNSCIDSEIKNIKSYEHLIDQDNIIILAQYESIRQLRSFLSNQELTIPVYCVNSNSLNILDTENTPFYFLINSNMKMEMFFIPIKEIPSYSKMYYMTIYKRFFEKELKF